MDITIDAVGRRDTSIVLTPPAADPAVTGEERRMRDCAFRDPSGNMIRIQEKR